MSIPGIRRIIGVHGAPRSGTSWLGQLFNSNEHVAYRYQPMFSYAFRDRLDAHSDASEISRFFVDLLHTEDEFVLQRGKSSLSGYELTFQKTSITHLVYKEVRFHDLLRQMLDAVPDFSGIGLIRNPCAVIYSWSTAAREFDPTWRLEDEWQHATSKNRNLAENWYGYRRWKELAMLFLDLRDRYPNRFHVVRYEDLVSEPESTLGMLYKFNDLPFTTQTREFLHQTHSRDDGMTYGVFRDPGNRSNEWRDRMDRGIIDSIYEDLSRSPLNDYLMPR